jgi:hypothetical protein
MNKCILILVTVFLLSCLTVAKSQRTMTEVVKRLYYNIENFDREWFLIGTLSDKYGHYQTFTSNKSIEDIDPSIKSGFDDGRKCVPDTLLCQRVTSYDDPASIANRKEVLLLIMELFKNNYPDLRMFVVCCPDSLTRHYDHEIKNNRIFYPVDSICRLNKHNFTVDLFSPSLAKMVASYYNFDHNNLSNCVISSCGDIGYRGIINKDRFTTEAQKLSFLTGVFLTYGRRRDKDYSIFIPNSLSALNLCYDLLTEFECTHIERDTMYYGPDLKCIERFPKNQELFFTPSAKLSKLMILMYELTVALKSLIF